MVGIVSLRYACVPGVAGGLRFGEHWLIALSLGTFGERRLSRPLKAQTLDASDFVDLASLAIDREPIVIRAIRDALQSNMWLQPCLTHSRAY
jgi:hypothetical protein